MFEVVQQMRHTGIVVKDLERPLDLWINLLGFEIESDEIERGEFIDSLLGLDDIEARVVKLTGGNSRIELLQFLNPPSTHEQSRSPSPFNRGLTHIALQVTDVWTIYERLDSSGYKAINPPQKSANDQFIVTYVLIHDGVYLELVEEVLSGNT